MKNLRKVINNLIVFMCFSMMLTVPGCDAKSAEVLLSAKKEIDHSYLSYKVKNESAKTYAERVSRNSAVQVRIEYSQASIRGSGTYFKYKGHSIHDILDMTVEESREFFKNIPGLFHKLKTLNDVGLGYICLGQPAPTLSGGEAQRVKLSTELSRHSTGKTLYMLDEPTTGLSFPDVASLLQVLQRLVDLGNTVIIIEHHLDVIKNADWVIDLGPGAGDEGGYIVATGTPEEIAQRGNSSTGQYLCGILCKKEGMLS